MAGKEANRNPNEPYTFSADRMVDTLRSAGTTGEKILRAAAFSFMRGLEVGRSAKVADDTAADGGKEKQPA